MSGPYEFGDVVDGYRWTVLGWEPVEGSEPAASAALQHALDTRLARPGVTHHVRHTSAAARPVAPTTSDADAAAEAEAADTATTAGVDPEPASDPGLAVTAGALVADTAPAQPRSAAPEPERRWTPVGWELVEPEVDAGDDLDAQDEGGRPAGVGDPIEEFADVLAAAPSAPPIEPDAELGLVVDVTTIELAGTEDGSTTEPDAEDVDVLDLREPVAARPVTLVEPPAGWYPG
jgi:hypothetical protein